MAMIDEQGVVLRNIQQQVQKNKDDIETLKQSGMGHEPVPGPQGPEGPRGERGEVGEKGNGFYGTASSLPSPTAYKDGDFFLLNNGNLYKKVNGKWFLQASMRGPQGIQGEEGSSIVPNPEGEQQGLLTKIEIDGVRYGLGMTVYFGEIQGDPTDNDLLGETLADIREVAEGKCKSFVLDTEQSIPTELDLELGNFVDSNGNKILSLEQLMSYVGGNTYANPDFNSNDSTLDMTNKWFIAQREQYYYVIKYVPYLLPPLKMGDIILVKQTEVPDRWMGTGSLLHQLETAKVDLTGYANTGEENTFLYDQMFDSDVHVASRLYISSTRFQPGSDGNLALFCGTTQVFNAYPSGFYINRNVYLDAGRTFRMGNTTLTEAQLQALLALLA